MISFTFWKLTSDSFPVLIQNHYVSHQTLFMKFNGLQHYQELRDLCQQDVVSLSFQPAALISYLLSYLHDYKIEDSPSKEASSKTTRPFLTSKESAPFLVLYQKIVFLSINLLFNKTLVTTIYQTLLSKIIPDMEELTV